METIWIVKKNTDMTEGRGHMKVHSVWNAPRTVVAEWLDKQGGIQGRKHKSHGGVMEYKWSEDKGGDWCLEQMPLLTCEEDIEEQEEAKNIIKALSKLSPSDIRLLGLEKKFSKFTTGD